MKFSIHNTEFYGDETFFMLQHLGQKGFVLSVNGVDDFQKAVQVVLDWFEKEGTTLVDYQYELQRIPDGYNCGIDMSTVIYKNRKPLPPEEQKIRPAADFSIDFSTKYYGSHGKGVEVYMRLPYDDVAIFKQISKLAETKNTIRIYYPIFVEIKNRPKVAAYLQLTENKFCGVQKPNECFALRMRWYRISNNMPME